MMDKCPHCGHDSYFYFVRVMYEYQGEFGKDDEEVANDTRLTSTPKTVNCVKCKRRIPIAKARGSK